MQGKIFLSGGGSEKDSIEIDKAFAKELLKSNKKLLYIPIAFEPERHPYDECLNWVSSVFKKFGFNKIIMWTDLHNKTLKDLSEFSGIYIGGGNTFNLLKKLRDARFDQLLIRFHEMGGHIYGGSAGAIILGRDIITASKDDVNECGLVDTKGLNLCRDYSIWCHYKPREDPLIKEYIKKYKLKIIAISEGAGVIINNGEFKYLGAGKVLIFS